MKCICDNCKKEININKLKRKYVGAMLTKDYFVCKHCNKEYISSVDNIKTRKLKEEINSVAKEIAFFKTLDVFNNREVLKELKEKHIELILECKMELKRLGNKFN